MRQCGSEWKRRRNRNKNMADHKFTLEEILREYDSDGKRSGIRREEDRPLSHGTLETEKKGRWQK